LKGDKPPSEFFVHERGICESADVGAGTRIWAFAHVLPKARIGRDCNICDHVFIENDVVLGDEVTVKSGVQLWDGVRLGNRVFVGPNATFTNDPFPRSRKPPAKFAETIVEEDASIGANATILPGLKIGRAAMVGAGAVVTDSVPAYAMVVGNPARIVGYRTEASAEAATTPVGSLAREAGSRVSIGVGSCALLRMPQYGDLRGSLAPIDFAKDLPFEPRRSFVVHDVPSRNVRGEHAHRTCHQFLVAAAGRLSVLVDDGANRREIDLEGPGIGLYLPPMIWSIQYKFEAHTLLLVFASAPYDAADYIRDYEVFRSAAGDGAS
jgi:UDP-2-acetamido-3-amino-2,3-dideoxy-glucuronate N-acetyltransferase